MTGLNLNDTARRLGMVIVSAYLSFGTPHLWRLHVCAYAVNIWLYMYGVQLTLIAYCQITLRWKSMGWWFEPPHDKTNNVAVRPAKTQISLGIRPVWSESSLCSKWIAKDTSFLHADSEDSDQTGRMPRLTWVFAGRTVILLVLSCRGSFCPLASLWKHGQ